MQKAYTLDRVPENEQLKEEDISLPSKAKMAFSLFRSLRDAGKSALEGKGLVADSDVSNKRIAICAKCPQFIKDQNRCSLCGCFLKAKVKMISESCPIGKW
jgi:hypothetical protein